MNLKKYSYSVLVFQPNGVTVREDLQLNLGICLIDLENHKCYTKIFFPNQEIREREFDLDPYENDGLTHNRLLATWLTVAMSLCRNMHYAMSFAITEPVRDWFGVSPKEATRNLFKVKCKRVVQSVGEGEGMCA